MRASHSDTNGIYISPDSEWFQKKISYSYKKAQIGNINDCAKLQNWKENKKELKKPLVIQSRNFKPSWDPKLFAVCFAAIFCTLLVLAFAGKSFCYKIIQN